MQARTQGEPTIDPEDDTTPAPSGSLRDTITAYVQLTKPRIIVLLLITTIPAMILAAQGIPPVGLMLATLVGGTVAAGSANAINMYLDRDIDEIMRRTRSRPLPSHSVTPDHALRFGFVLGAISYFFLSITVNVLAATLALSAIAFYVFVYTMWLKRTTTQNIVIGGAAGAVPALVGWAAVTGSLAAPGVDPVRDHLRVDAAALLGALDPFQRRLRRGGRADAARREGRGRDPAPDLPLLARALRHVVGARIRSAIWDRSTWRRRSCWAASSSTGRSACGARRRRDRAWGVFTYSIVYLAALFGAVALDAIAPLSR